jgi:hypothetical protein
MIYLVVFLASLGVDLVPIVAPPAWTIMAFLLVKYELNPWLVLAVGVPGSALGRYFFSLYIPKFSDKVLAKRKKAELRYAATSWTSGCGKPGRLSFFIPSHLCRQPRSSPLRR